MNAERLFLPSASNAGLRAQCAGAWQLIQLLRASGKLTTETPEAAQAGVAIHAARAAGSNDLPEDRPK